MIVHFVNSSKYCINGSIKPWITCYTHSLFVKTGPLTILSQTLPNCSIAACKPPYNRKWHFPSYLIYCLLGVDHLLELSELCSQVRCHSDRCQWTNRNPACSTIMIRVCSFYFSLQPIHFRSFLSLYRDILSRLFTDIFYQG